jgi:hypothetical protein
MNIIETTAPIGIEFLKQYFTDKSITFMIDYEKSELKGQKLLTYLSNLELPCDIKNHDEDLILDYLKTTSIVNIPALEQDVLRLILNFKNGEDVPFKDEIAQWEKKLDSLSLFNVYAINSETMQNWVKQFPEDDTNSLDGVNFVSLLKHEQTYQLYENVNEDNLTYYSKYFNDYMFKGNNLYSFWAHENNPMFILTWGITSGEAQKIQEAQR